MNPTFHEPKFDSPLARQNHLVAKGRRYAQQIVNWAMKCGPDIFPSGLDQAANYLMSERFPYRQWASKTTLPEIGAWMQKFTQMYCEISRSNATMDSDTVGIIKHADAKNKEEKKD